MIIAFSGKKGAGKTVAANYLVALYGFKKISFADKLKFESMRDMGFTREQVYGKLKEVPFNKEGNTPREYMIKYGQFKRYWDNEYWTRVVLKEITKHPRTSWAIDDLRYKNEAKILETRETKLVRIERYKKNNPYKNGIFTNDESETQLDNYKFHHKIESFNNENLGDLHKRLDIIMRLEGHAK